MKVELLSVIDECGLLPTAMVSFRPMLVPDQRGTTEEIARRKRLALEAMQTPQCEGVLCFQHRWERTSERADVRDAD